MVSIGCKKDKKEAPIPLPELLTTNVTQILMNTVLSGGSVSTDGGSTITARGVCWSTNQMPTIADNKTTDGSGAGIFSSAVTGLQPGTKYYLRAYATNSNGTGYGASMVFTTVANTITDIDGNTYRVVQIGNQIWMAENLRTTKYNDGATITNQIDNTLWSNSTTGAYCWYNNDAATYKTTYGALYNGYAVKTGKLCPTGWHVPTDVDFETLITYLGGAGFAGGKLKETGTTHWNAPNTSADNSSGFTAVPGGLRFATGTYANIGSGCNLWTASEIYSTNLWYFSIYYNYAVISSYDANKKTGLSVRCLMD